MAKQTPTIDDVLKLAAEIDEAGLDAEIAALEAKLKKLKEAKATISVLKHGRPERKKPVRKAKSAAATPSKTIKQQVIDYLEIQSPAKPAIIASDLGLGYQSVYQCLVGNVDRFRKVGDGFTLTNGSAH